MEIDNSVVKVPESPPISQGTESQDRLLERFLVKVRNTDNQEEEEVYNIISESVTSSEDEELDEIEEIASPPQSTKATATAPVFIPNKSSNKDDVVIEMETETEAIMHQARQNDNVNVGEDSFMDLDDDILMAEVERLERENNIGSSSPSPKVSTSQSSAVGIKAVNEKRKEIENLKRLDPTKIFPDVKANPNGFHTVAFLLKPEYKPGDDLQPHPTTFHSKWDPDFVPMPCSHQNTRIFKIRISQEANNPDDKIRFREDRVRLWERIEQALRVPLLCVADIQFAMRQYLPFSLRTEFLALKYAVESIMSQRERENLFDKVIPCMQTLVLDTERMITCPIPLLKKFKNHSISFSQTQIACLLANAFFSTFPPRLEHEEQFPTINFFELFQCNEDDNENSRLTTKGHKIRCILNYFTRIADEMPKGVVTYTRKSIRNSTAPKWDECTDKLSKIIPVLQGTIEDDGVGMLQVDFANKIVGGGVLGGGAVQEEILFVIYPELLLSRLLTEKLASCESLLVTGCERFSRYKGYARSFRYDGDFYDTTPYDKRGRRCAQIVAIDALYITRPITQFHHRFLTRELNKAYVGFSSPTATSFAVATGKWGCGAFNGNPQLKAILQLLAGSKAGRDIVFFTFNDAVIEQEILAMYSIIKDKTIAEVWRLLVHYHTICCTTAMPKYDLCEFFDRFGSSPLAAIDAVVSNDKPQLKSVPITHFYSTELKPPSTVALMSNLNTKDSTTDPSNEAPVSKHFKNSPSPTDAVLTIVPQDPLNDEQITGLLAMDSQSAAVEFPCDNNPAKVSLNSVNDNDSQQLRDDEPEEEGDDGTPQIVKIFNSKPSTLNDFYK